MNPYILGVYEKAMPTSISWEKRLELTRQSNFDCMELSVDESEARLARLHWTKSQLLEVKQAIKNTGVPMKTMCLSAHRSYPLGAHDSDIRKKSLDIMSRAIDLACELNIRIIQLAGYDVYYEPSDAFTVEQFQKNLKVAVENAAKCGVMLGFETMETPFMDTVQKTMQFVNQIQSPYLGVYPDIGNLKNASVLYQTDIVDDIKLGKGSIVASHLKETSPGVYRDMFFGEGGHTEYERCIKELWGQGVRIYMAEFWDHGNENYQSDLLRASSFLREKIERAAKNFA